MLISFMKNMVRTFVLMEIVHAHHQRRLLVVLEWVIIMLIPKKD